MQPRGERDFARVLKTSAGSLPYIICSRVKGKLDCETLARAPRSPVTSLNQRVPLRTFPLGFLSWDKDSL